MNQSPTQLAVQAATEVAIAQGLQFDRAIVLQDLSNVVLHLAPLPVVAKVAPLAANYRSSDRWFVREVAVAKHLTQSGAPIIPVSDLLEPGPHQHSGLILSFWQFVTVLPGACDPILAGQTLKQCHDRLVNFTGELPRLALITEAQEILQTLISIGEFNAADADMLERIAVRSLEQLAQFPMQPIHGDSHLGNVLNTAQGLHWTDWEDVFVGPVEWDLASIVAASRVFGTEQEQVALALQGYGGGFDPLALERCIVARTLVALVWSIVLSKRHPSPNAQVRIDRRLDWLRQHESR